MKKILIVEDEVLIAEELRSLVKKLEYSVVGVVHNADKVTDKVNNKDIDLVLLDINLQGIQDGIDVAHHLNRMGVAFAYITSYSDRETIERVKSTRPYGYLLKPFNLDDIRVLLEMAFFRSELKESRQFPSFDMIRNKASISFTKTEYQITRDIFDGLTNAQIASKNYVSINTVKSHIRNIYNKLKVQSKTELISKILSL